MSELTPIELESNIGKDVNGVENRVPYDGNLTNYTKETKELLKLCKRACDRIAKEIV